MRSDRSVGNGHLLEEEANWNAALPPWCRAVVGGTGRHNRRRRRRSSRQHPMSGLIEPVSRFALTLSVWCDRFEPDLSQ